MCAAYCLTSKSPQSNLVTWIYCLISSLILNSFAKLLPETPTLFLRSNERRFLLALTALSNPHHQVQSVRRWRESEQQVPQQWGIAACCNGVSQWAVLCLSVGDIASWKSAHWAQSLRSWTWRGFFSPLPASSLELSQASSEGACPCCRPRLYLTTRAKPQVQRTVFLTARLSFHRALFVPLSCWVC